MKIEKLPSGSYRMRKMYKGKTYTVVTEYKPTQKEAIQLLAEAMKKEKPSAPARLDFASAAEEYISVKENVLSPSTIVGYRSVLKNLSDSFRFMLLNDISSIDIQKEINDYSVNRSPKTVRNAHGLISAILGMFRPDMNINTTLPQKRKNDEYIPSDEDVKRVLNHAKGTKYEIPLFLATLGLRRSEICALTVDDLDGNILTIDKALVISPDGDFSEKGTKTADGTRQIYIPNYLAELIREKGVIYDGFPGSILRYLKSTQDKLGIKRFRLHALRHYYASMSHSLGIPDSYIMQAGGWKSDGTLKSVYRHAMDDKKEEMQKFASQYVEEMLK